MSGLVSFKNVYVPWHPKICYDGQGQIESMVFKISLRCHPDPDDYDYHEYIIFNVKGTKKTLGELKYLEKGDIVDIEGWLNLAPESNSFAFGSTGWWQHKMRLILVSGRIVGSIDGQQAD